MDNMMKITNKRGRTFNVRIVKVGDKYGLDDCLTHKEEKYCGGPLVEFYDATYENETFGERGQFVSRYYASTLLGRDYNENRSLADQAGIGLDLMGYEPVWKIDGQAMDIVRAWVDNQTEGEL